jgi:hypothetical protein
MPYADQSIRVFEGQGLQEHAVHDAEDRRVAADADRQRQHGYAAEERCPRESAKGVSELRSE